MANVYLQLLGIAGNHKPEKRLPDTARAYIALKLGSTARVNQTEFTTISEECRTSEEVEEAADLLIEELKTIKKQAAGFFKKEKKDRTQILKKNKHQRDTESV